MTVPRPEKAAVVAEVRDRLAASDAALLTEYRGLNVGEMAALRRSLRAVGGEYTIYKNTMVRLATAELGVDMAHLLTGPTAIAFVGARDDGSAADAAAVAKALRDFSRANRALVLKGGLLGDKVLGAEDLVSLAELPSRELLLARLAGAFSAPMTKLAGLLQALPRNFAYGLQALIDAGGGPGGAAPAPPEQTSDPDQPADAEQTSDPDQPADADQPADPDQPSETEEA